jgi:pimeloyl-ACP methyl ester carboxylesterase
MREMRTTTVAAAGTTLRVIEAGTGEPAVLFVHGVGGWAENWTEAQAAVAASGRRAIAFDLPGFGASPPVRGARYFDPRAPFYAAVVEGVQRALGLARPHLVGHSLGGAIAAVSAIVRPEAFASLTLVAPGGAGPDLPQFLRLLTLPGADRLARLRPASVGRAVLESCFHDRRRIPAHLYAEERRFAATAPETARVLRAVATLRGVRPELRAGWLARTAAYRGPVLVVWGREDGILPAAHVAALRASHPDAEMAVIPEAGHLVMAEQPAAFAAALVPFLARSERAGAAARTMGPGVAHQQP